MPLGEISAGRMRGKVMFNLVLLIRSSKHPDQWRNCLELSAHDVWFLLAGNSAVLRT